MSGIFTKPKAPSLPPPPVREEGPSSEEIADAERKRRAELARRQGRSGTILGGGVGDEIDGKTLLGQ